MTKKRANQRNQHLTNNRRNENATSKIQVPITRYARLLACEVYVQWIADRLKENECCTIYNDTFVKKLLEDWTWQE